MPLISAAGVAGSGCASYPKHGDSCPKRSLGTLWQAGRRLETIGITSQNIDEARRRFDAILSGGL